MIARRKGALALFVIAGICVLAGLGTWQLYRLDWKRDLITRIRASIDANAVTIDDAEAGLEHGLDIDWLKVRARGRYDHGAERHLYSLRKAKAGWRVLTPLVAPGDFVVLVDRGFVPEGNKDSAQRVLPSTQVEVTGLVRMYPGTKPAFAADNQPTENRWFWPDIVQLYASLPRDIGVSNAIPPRYMPFIVQLIPGGEPAVASSPIVDVPAVNLPNRHLGYALTWYGLAIVLAVIGLLLSRKRQ